jgi:hypothetical protein
MEFIVGHGWAFLILGVVFAALYFFGAFRTSIGNAGVCSSSAGFTCTNVRLSTNYKDTCGGTYTSMGAYAGGGTTGHPAMNVTVSTYSGPWTGVYLVEVPNGQTINDINPNGPDNGQPYDFFFWEANVGRGAILMSLAPNQQMQVSMCLSSSLASANSIGKSVSGTIWVMYNSIYTPYNLAQVGTFTVTASR